MSTLAEDIRAQARVATTLATSMTDEARKVRRTSTDTEWVSAAATEFQRVLEGYGSSLDSSAASLRSLSSAISVHASAVETAEAALKAAAPTAAAALTLPVTLATTGAHAVSSVVGPLTSSSKHPEFDERDFGR